MCPASYFWLDIIRWTGANYAVVELVLCARFRVERSRRRFQMEDAEAGGATKADLNEFPLSIGSA